MESRFAFALVFAAAISSGVMGGVLYGFSTGVMSGLGRLPPGQAAAAMNAINVAVINPAFLGLFMGTAVLCLALAAGCFFVPQSLPGRWIVLAGSLVYLLGALGVTMVFNVPMNDQLAAFQPGSAAELWPHYLAVWTNWNHVRTAAAIASAILFTSALL